MNKIIDKPYIPFFVLIPVFIIITFFKYNAVMDINFHDTYFVIEVTYLCYLSAFFFALVGLNYYVLHLGKKPPKKGLTIAHIIFQAFSLLLYIYSLLSTTENSDSLIYFNDNAIDQNTIFALSFILFLIATVIHFINFITSLLAKRE